MVDCLWVDHILLSISQTFHFLCKCHNTFRKCKTFQAKRFQTPSSGTFLFQLNFQHWPLCLPPGQWQCFEVNDLHAIQGWVVKWISEWRQTLLDGLSVITIMIDSTQKHFFVFLFKFHFINVPHLLQINCQGHDDTHGVDPNTHNLIILCYKR